MLQNIFNFADIHICLIILLNLMVIFLKNPIHALLCFIFGVINVIAVFIFFEADFVALIFFLVYVGAIAVLFLALLMFLNLSYLFYTETSSSFLKTIKSKAFYYVLFLFLIITSVNEIFTIQVNLPTISNISLNFFGTHYMAYLMYTKFSFLIVFSGFLLLFTTILTLMYTTLPRYFNNEILQNITHREMVYRSLLNLEIQNQLKSYNTLDMLLNSKSRKDKI